VQSKWFKIIEFLGVIAFSFSGVLIALRQNTSVFGAYVFALLPSLGGGIIRDLIIGHKSYGQMIKTEYLVTVAIIVLVSFLIIRFYNLITKKTMSPEFAKKVLGVFDGLGLSCFTAVGVVVAIISRQEPIYLWGPFLAFITAAGGATLRDVLREDKYISAVAGGFYAEIPLLWGLIPSLYLYFNVEHVTEQLIFKGIIFVVIGAFVTRALFLAFGLRSIPLSALRRIRKNQEKGVKNVK
jgi:polar amino acid transport system substrate-binding protein